LTQRQFIRNNQSRLLIDKFPVPILPSANSGILCAPVNRAISSNTSSNPDKIIARINDAIQMLLRVHVRVNGRAFYFRIDCRHNDIAMATTGNASQAGNNSELSGNDSTVYLGRASLVARSGIIITTKLIVSLFLSTDPIATLIIISKIPSC